MGFQKDWNKELIAQFYATVHFGYLKNERAIFWMIEGNYYRATFVQFIRVLGLDRHDANRPKIHNLLVLPNEEIKFMYPRGETGNAGKVTRLYTYYSILNRLRPFPREVAIHRTYHFMQRICLHALGQMDKNLVWLTIYGRKLSISQKTH